MLFEYDASNDKCPLPLVKTRVILKKMAIGDRFILLLSDPGSLNDIPKYLRQHGWLFSQKTLDARRVQFSIEKESP